MLILAWYVKYSLIKLSKFYAVDVFKYKWFKQHKCKEWIVVYYKQRAGKWYIIEIKDFFMTLSFE